MIKTLSLMLERPTAKTATHGKCVEHWLHLSHISLIVLAVIHDSYYKYSNSNNLKRCYYTCSCFYMLHDVCTHAHTLHMHHHTEHFDIHVSRQW